MGTAADHARILQTALRPTRAVIDLAVLRGNLLRLREHLGDLAAGARPPGIYAVVKADAYGHGAVSVATTLERAGVDGFAVSLVEEGIELRRVTSRPVLVLAGSYDRAADEVVRYGLTPVVSDPRDLEMLSRAAGDTRLAIHLKLDTGMSRLGVQPSDLARTLTEIAQLGNLELAGLSTHLASADAVDASPTALQLDAFDRALAEVTRAGHSLGVRHAANSAAAIRFRQSHYELVRPGIALFGDAASPEAELPGAKPVLRLVTRVLQLREVAPGTGVSYGATWRARRRSRIATLPLGYADGYPRRLGGKAHVLVAGEEAPVVGVVCMDMFMVDVTDLPAVHAGDEVVLLGEQGGRRISASDWARWAETANYEIYCGISKRVPRVYEG